MCTLPGCISLELQLKDLSVGGEVMKLFSPGVFLLNPRYQEAVEGAGCSMWWSWTPELLHDTTVVTKASMLMA